LQINDDDNDDDDGDYQSASLEIPEA